MDDRTLQLLDLIQNQLGIIQIQLGRAIDDLKLGGGGQPSQGVLGTEILGWHIPVSRGE